MAQDNKQIALDQLQAIFNGIVDHMRSELNVQSINLHHDYYWSVSEADLYRSDGAPEQLEIGSLFDDWDFLLRLLDSEEERLPIMLMHLAPLLRYIARYVNSYPAPTLPE